MADDKPTSVAKDRPTKCEIFMDRLFIYMKGHTGEVTFNSEPFELAQAGEVSLRVAVDLKAILDIQEVWSGLRDHAKYEIKDSGWGEPYKIKAEVKRAPIELTVTFVDNVKAGLAEQEKEKWLEELKEITKEVKDITELKGIWDMLRTRINNYDELSKIWEFFERKFEKQELATVIGEKPSKGSAGVDGDGDSHGG